MITYVQQPAVSTDALRLNEDIFALNKCRQLLNLVDEFSVADTRDEGYKLLRLAKAHINACHRHAWDKMRQEYLAPVRKKIERKPSKRI